MYICSCGQKRKCSYCNRCYCNPYTFSENRAYDTNLHMIHHNKKVNSAKSIVNTSPPRSYRQRSNISNLHSRFSTPTLSNSDTVPSRANSNCDVRRRKITSHKNEERSSSVPPRPPTRRKPNVQPQNYLKTENNFPKITDNFNKKIPLKNESPKYSPKRNFDNNKSPTQTRQASPIKTPVPTPREFSGVCKLPNVPEHEYLQFALRITEDIIRNDLYSQKEMRRVFSSHIEANRGRLSMNKMLQQIDHLCNALNLSKKSQDQNLLNKQVPCFCKTMNLPKSGTISTKSSKEHVLKKIIEGEYAITENEIQELNEKDLEEVLSRILNDDIFDIISAKPETDQSEINSRNIAVEPNLVKLETIERNSNNACREIIEGLLYNVNQEISENDEILSKIEQLKADNSLNVILNNADNFVSISAENLKIESSVEDLDVEDLQPEKDADDSSALEIRNSEPEKDEDVSSALELRNSEFGKRLNDIQEIEEEQICKVVMENEVYEDPTKVSVEKNEEKPVEEKILQETIVTSIISDILNKIEDTRIIKKIVGNVEIPETEKSLDKISAKSIKLDNKCTQTSFQVEEEKFVKISVYEYDDTGVFHFENFVPTEEKIEKKCPDCEPTCVKNTENDFISAVEKSIKDQTKDLYLISPHNNSTDNKNEIDTGEINNEYITEYSDQFSAKFSLKHSSNLLENEVMAETIRSSYENNEKLQIFEENNDLNLENEVISSPEDLLSESNVVYTTEYMDQFSKTPLLSHESFEKSESIFEVKNFPEKLNQNIDYTEISEKSQFNYTNQENKSTKKNEKDIKNTSSREKSGKNKFEIRKSPQKLAMRNKNSVDCKFEYCKNKGMDCSQVFEKSQLDLNKYEIKSLRKSDRNSSPKSSKNKTDNLFDNSPTFCKNKRSKQFSKKLHVCPRNCDKDILKTPENNESSLSEGEIKYCVKENSEISKSILEQLKKYEQDAKIPKTDARQLVCLCDYELNFYGNKNYNDYVPKFERTIFFPNVGTQTSETEIDIQLLSDGEVQNTSSSEIDESTTME